MTTSTEICLADVRRAASNIRLAMQVNTLRSSGKRLAFIDIKLMEVSKALESQVIAEKEINRQ